MAHPDSPQPQPQPQPDTRAALTREQRMHELHEELLKLNAQLEYLRLMLKMRAPSA